MSISIDNAPSSTFTASSASSLTFAVTRASGGNGALFVNVKTVGAAVDPTGITFNGVSMQKLGGMTCGSAARLSVWRLLAPASGTHNVVVTMAASTTAISATAMVYSSTNPLSTDININPAAVASATSLANALTVKDQSFIHIGGLGVNHNLTASTNVTSTTSSDPIAGYFGPRTGAGSTSLSVSDSGADTIFTFTVELTETDTSVGSYPTEVTADAPLIYYRLDDASPATTIHDSSGNGHNGTLSGSSVSYQVTGATTDGDTAMTWTPGNVQIDSGQDTNPGSNDFCCETWIKTTHSGSIVMAWTKLGATANFWLGVLSGGTMEFSTVNDSGGNVNCVGLVTVNDGTYHYIVAQRTSGLLQIYVDAILDETAFQTVAMTPSGVDLLLGSFSNSFYYSGTIDESAYYGAASLSQKRIFLHKKAALSSSASSSITEQNLPSNHNGNITVHVVGSGTSYSSSTTWTPSGVAGWSVASKTFVDATHYTVVLTPPGAATPPSGATGTLSLTEGVSGATVATTVIGTPTLSLSPNSGSTGTTPTVTLTGTNTIWSVETTSGLFTESGGTGAGIGTPTVSSNTSASAVVTVGSSAGSLTIKDTSTGATATFTANTGPTTILVNDVHIFWSPYNTFISGNTFAEWINPGAYFVLVFTGTSIKMGVDTSFLSSASTPAKNYPRIRYWIDGVSFTDYQLLSSDTTLTLATGLAAGQHTIWMNLLSTDTAENRWNGTMSLRVTNIVLDAGATVSTYSSRPKRVIMFGDSICEGAWNLGSPSDPTNYSLFEDATSSFIVDVALALNAEYGNCSFGGQSFTAGTAGVPGLESSWNFIMASTTRLSAGLFTPSPDYIISNMGHNGNPTSAATYQALLGSWRTAAPGAKIITLQPLSGTNSTVASGYSLYQAATPDANAFLVDLSVLFGISGTIPGYESFDGVHPSLFGDARFGSITTAAIVQTVGGGGATSGINRAALPSGLSALG